MANIRCSSLPLISACAAASVPPETRIDPSRGAADLGTAFHECMARFIVGKPVDVAEIASANNVEVNELVPMFGWASALWRERLVTVFPNPLVEDYWLYSDGGLTLTGHADLMSLCEDNGIIEVRGLDWKSGWLDTDASQQMKGYAFLAMQRWRHAATARITVLRVREQRAETLVWTRAELNAWVKWLTAHLATDDTFRPGEWCGRCPRALECPAHESMVRSWASFATVPPAGNELAPSELAHAVVFVRLLMKRAESFLMAAKSHVEANGGELGPLYIDERETRSIEFARGHEIIIEQIGGHAFMPCVSISKSAVEEAVKRDAPRGQKGQRVKDLMERLEAAGAIETSKSRTLKVRREHGDSNSNGSGPAAIEAGEPVSIGTGTD